MTAEVEVCSCEEALALRRELSEAQAKATDFENHWKNACDVGRRLEARLKRETDALTIAENRVAELLPLRDAVAKLTKAKNDLRDALRRREARA